MRADVLAPRARAMKLLLLTPGTGSFYCGSCLRDDALGRGLARAGHAVTTVPLYLPPFLEHPAPRRAVQLGAISLYLQQRSALLRRLPHWLLRCLDRRALLRLASRAAGTTGGTDLSAMTLAMLRGTDGLHAGPIGRLVDRLAAGPRPDAVLLSNALLLGLAPPLRAALARPVVVTLQGEEPFLDALAPAAAAASWRELRTRAAAVAAFVAVSASYGARMQQRLALPAAAVHVVHNGIDLDDFPTAPTPLAARAGRTIGFLARHCRDKGLDVLVDAFALLAARGMHDVRLAIAGVQLRADRPFVRELRDRLAAQGLGGRVAFLPNITRRAKIALLDTLSVLAVPSAVTESFGLFVLEALAAGVPIVAPRHSAFPELLAATGGGIDCAPGDAADLARALAELLADLPRAQALAWAGRQAVHARFTADRMAGDVAALCARLAQNPTERPCPPCS
jgi:glycosyltransferase involved in cell wall biosynthesis